MNELLTKQNELVEEAGEQIIKFETAIKELQEKEKQFREALLNQMQERGVKSVKYKNLTISLTDAHVTEKFDSKAFKADYEQLYNEYVKLTDVKASVAIRIK